MCVPVGNKLLIACTLFLFSENGLHVTYHILGCHPVNLADCWEPGVLMYHYVKVGDISEQVAPRY